MKLPATGTTFPATQLTRNSWARALERIPAVKEALVAVVEGDGSLDEAGRHHLARPGKLGRARLALAACDALGVGESQAVSLAVACELLHNASLVHDDLQDRDRERRGSETVWRRFGDATAVNLGDFLLTAAVHVAATIDAAAETRLALVEAFTGSTLAVIRGQAADTDERLPTVGRYEAIARTKTGPLLALPVEAALILAGYGAGARALAREAMGEAGVAFQIEDDLLDLSGRKGREPGSDLRAGRPNAVLLHYLEQASDDERARVSALEAPGAETVADLVQRIRRSPAPRRCRDLGRRFAERALYAAADLPEPLADVIHHAVDAWVTPTLVQVEVKEHIQLPTVIPVETQIAVPV